MTHDLDLPCTQGPLFHSKYFRVARASSCSVEFPFCNSSMAGLPWEAFSLTLCPSQSCSQHDFEFSQTHSNSPPLTGEEFFRSSQGSHNTAPHKNLYSILLLSSKTKSHHVPNIYHGLGSVSARSTHKLIYIVTGVLWESCFYLHFIDEEMEMKQRAQSHNKTP